MQSHTDRHHDNQHRGCDDGSACAGGHDRRQSSGGYGVDRKASGKTEGGSRTTINDTSGARVLEVTMESDDSMNVKNKIVRETVSLENKTVNLKKVLKRYYSENDVLREKGGNATAVGELSYEEFRALWNDRALQRRRITQLIDNFTSNLNKDGIVGGSYDQAYSLHNENKHINIQNSSVNQRDASSRRKQYRRDSLQSRSANTEARLFPPNNHHYAPTSEPTFVSYSHNCAPPTNNQHKPAVKQHYSCECPFCRSSSVSNSFTSDISSVTDTHRNNQHVDRMSEELYFQGRTNRERRQKRRFDNSRYVSRTRRRESRRRREMMSSSPLPMLKHINRETSSSRNRRYHPEKIGCPSKMYSSRSTAAETSLDLSSTRAPSPDIYQRHLQHRYRKQTYEKEKPLRVPSPKMYQKQFDQYHSKLDEATEKPLSARAPSPELFQKQLPAQYEINRPDKTKDKPKPLLSLNITKADTSPSPQIQIQPETPPFDLFHKVFTQEVELDDFSPIKGNILM